MPPADITPPVPGGSQVIEAYGDGGFRIAGRRHEGSVVVFPERTLAWPVRAAADIDVGTLPLKAGGTPPVKILLIGCGRRFVPPPPGLRPALKSLGIVLEWMDTGAACRTFNVLLAENRPAAAALIAVGNQPSGVSGQ